MRLATVKIRNDKTGQVKKINQQEWLEAMHFGKYHNYSLASEQHSGRKGEDVIVAKDSEFRKPDPVIETPAETPPIQEMSNPIPETVKEIPDFDIGKMSKDELCSAAKEFYDEELDSNKHLLSLRREFSELVGGATK